MSVRPICRSTVPPGVKPVTRVGVSSGSGIVLSSPTDAAASETTALIGVTTNTAAGTIYWVVTSSATAPTAEQIQAGEDHTGAAAVDSGSASATAGVNLDGPTGLTAATTYYAHFVQVSGSTVSNVVSGDGFTTLTAGAPTLTSPSGTATGETTADLSVSTNEANGTIYWVVTNSATTPSVAQIKAGKDHTGSAAVDSGNENPSATGAQVYEAVGLAAETGHYAHFVHTDLEANDSTAVSSAMFTTLDETSPILTDASGEATSETTGDIVVTTDEGNGIIYWVVTTSATQPLGSQVKAGEDHTGSAAVASGNASVSTTGEKTGSVTGLTASTSYYGHWMHEDSSGNQSSVVSTSAWATLSSSSGLSESPAHWWDLDDDGVWADSVGGWSLTESSTVSVVSSGPNGQDVADLNGTSYLTRTNVAWDGVGNPRSFSVWFYADAVASIGNWVFSWRSETEGNRIMDVFVFNASTDYIRCLFDGASGAADLGSSSVSPVSPSQWYHVVGTTNGSNSHKLYVNGALVDTDTTSIGNVTGSSHPFAIGAAAWNKALATQKHNGQVTMLGVWDAELTSDDVAYLYNGGDGRQFADL